MKNLPTKCGDALQGQWAEEEIHFSGSSKGLWDNLTTTNHNKATVHCWSANKSRRHACQNIGWQMFSLAGVILTPVSDRPGQCRIKVGAIDAAALGPLLKIGPPS